MKRIFYSILFFTLALLSCNKSDQGGVSNLSIKLIDAPAGYDKVNIDISGVQILVNDSTIELDVEKGIYNLLDLVNGKDVVLADQQIPSGKISQIRLILGENNSLVIGDETFNLTTPSSQQSGLKLNIHDNFESGIAYEYTIDFDAAKSIVSTGSGKYILKPVLRVFTSAASGAIRGVIAPIEAHPVVSLTLSDSEQFSTYSDPESGEYMFSGVPEGTYTLTFDPEDPFSSRSIGNILVKIGEVTRVDTVKFN